MYMHAFNDREAPTDASMFISSLPYIEYNSRSLLYHLTGHVQGGALLGQDADHRLKLH
jgi:hypothetical protein